MCSPPRGGFGWVRAASAAVRCWLLALAAALITVNWGMFIYGGQQRPRRRDLAGVLHQPAGQRAAGRRASCTSGCAAASGWRSPSPPSAVVVLTVDYGRPPWIALTLAFSFGLYGLSRSAPGRRHPGLSVETALLVVPAAAYSSGCSAAGRGTFAAQGAGHAPLLVGSGVATAIPLMLFGAAAVRIPLPPSGLLQYITPVMQLPHRRLRLRRADAAGAAGGVRHRLDGARGLHARRGADGAHGGACRPGGAQGGRARAGVRPLALEPLDPRDQVAAERAELAPSSMNCDGLMQNVVNPAATCSGIADSAFAEVGDRVGVRERRAGAADHLQLAGSRPARPAPSCSRSQVLGAGLPSGLKPEPVGDEAARAAASCSDSPPNQSVGPPGGGAWARGTLGEG